MARDAYCLQVVGGVAAYIGGMDFFGSMMFALVAIGFTVASAAHLNGFLWRKGLDENAASLVAWGYGFIAVFVLVLSSLITETSHFIFPPRLTAPPT